MGAPALAPHGTIGNDVIQVSAGTLKYGLTVSSEKWFSVTLLLLYTNALISLEVKRIINI